MFYRQIGDGSARAETNSSQSVTSTLTPDAFGNAVATTGSTGSSYQFGATSGYRNDGDAGLLKVGCRYYDPQVGAFTTRDTYLDQKPYLYCEHDPVNATDPSGHVIDWGKLGKNVKWGVGVVIKVGSGMSTIGAIYLAFEGYMTLSDDADRLHNWKRENQKYLDPGNINGPVNSDTNRGSADYIKVIIRQREKQQLQGVSSLIGQFHDLIWDLGT